MLAWEIFGEDLLWIEVYAGVALLAGIAAWTFVSRIPVSLLALILTIAIIGAGAFRPIGYNSDTENYYSYVYFLRFVSGSEIFFLTKLEPVHSGLILILQDFRLWLIVEALIMALGLFLSYRNKPDPQSFLILCAFVLTLSTSSLRYCSAVIYFYYFISKASLDIPRAARMTLILSCFHISMLLSGALALQRRYAPLAVTALCLAIFFESSFFLGGRIGIDYDGASTGLKTLTVALIPLLYLIFRQPLEKSVLVSLYLISLLSIFLVTSTILFTFNRYLIIGALVVMVLLWPQVRGRATDFFDRGIVLAMASVIVAPYVYALPRLYFSGLW